MTEVGDPAILHGTGDLARQYHQQICRLYDSVFSVEPFIWTDDASSVHAHELAELRDDPTFGITIALADGTVIGFAYGHRLPRNHGWWEGFPRPLPTDLTDEWEGRTFALINFAVDTHRRGQGIGKRLLTQLLDQREEERVLLSVQPNAAQTQQIYRHLGWRQIGRKGPLAEAVTPYWDIYLLPAFRRAGW